jgi:hypothetical protein
MLAVMCPAGSLPSASPANQKAKARYLSNASKQEFVQDFNSASLNTEEKLGLLATEGAAAAGTERTPMQTT